MSYIDELKKVVTNYCDHHGIKDRESHSTIKTLRGVHCSLWLQSNPEASLFEVKISWNENVPDYPFYIKEEDMRQTISELFSKHVNEFSL